MSLLEATQPPFALSPDVLEVPYSQVAHFRLPARREQTSVADRPGARWFLLADAGCGGVFPIHRGYRLFGLFVRPELRKNGLGFELIAHRIAWARAQGAPFVDTIALRPARYLALGFQPTYTTRGGYAVLKLNLEELPWDSSISGPPATPMRASKKPSS